MNESRLSGKLSSINDLSPYKARVLGAESPGKKLSDGELTDTEKNFNDKGLNTNKQLKNYDCWDDDLKP